MTTAKQKADAIEAANRMTNQQHQIQLSQRDWEMLMNLVAADTEPTPAASEAAERYKSG